MAPVRRYLRISSYSVLEVRIYLDNPADVHRWLLGSSSPALPRIIDAVKPLVLPKLREENERNKKGGKKKGVKDVVIRDDFDVSIFLTELSTPHSILTRSKTFKDETHDGAGTKSEPFDVEMHKLRDPAIRREDSEEEQKVDLGAIPAAREISVGGRQERPLAISDSDEDQASHGRSSAYKRQRKEQKEDVAGQDDKKKLGFQTGYDGFRIHGRILCLVVKRKGRGKGRLQTNGADATTATTPTGQAMMENWITSSQDVRGMLNE